MAIHRLGLNREPFERSGSINAIKRALEKNPKLLDPFQAFQESLRDLLDGAGGLSVCFRQLTGSVFSLTSNGR